MTSPRLTPNLHQLHPFHLVTPSPSPLLTSFQLGALATLAVAFFQSTPSALANLLFALGVTALFMAVWWRDVVTEGFALGDHTTHVQRAIGYGMVTFIISEVFVFVGIFWAFFHSALSPTVELGCSWPPQAIQALDTWGLPTMNTALLLASGATVTVAHHATISARRRVSLEAMVATLALAIVFTYFQGMEYSDASFAISDGVYGSVFYASTGVHGFHVVIGASFLAVCLARIYDYQLASDHHKGLESAIAYWHLVDVVWLVLFAAVYGWAGNV